MAGPMAMVDSMESVRLKLSPRPMLIPTTMEDMVDMADTGVMVLDWDTGAMVLAMAGPMAMVDSMESVRLKLSPRPMLIPTTMVDMDWEDMVDMADTGVTVL